MIVIDAFTPRWFMEAKAKEVIEQELYKLVHTFCKEALTWQCEQDGMDFKDIKPDEDWVKLIYMMYVST